MSKSKRNNAFYYFMVDRQPAVEKRLRRRVLMNEMARLVTQEWNALPEAEKKKYQLMCGAENKGKLDCRGIPLRQLEEEALSRRRQAEEMKRDIAELVDMYHLGRALHQVTFFVVSTSYYAYTDDERYVPAELSFLRFSLKTGIMKEFHTIITPDVPRSYGASAKSHSQDTHKLPYDTSSYGRTIGTTARKLKEFLANEWDEHVPVYTLHEDIEKTRQILNLVTGKELKVYSLDMLFQIIYSEAVHFIPQSIATDMITECGLDYFPNMACDVHNNELQDGARFCTLSCIRRWVYFMCQHLKLKELFGVVPQEGKHYPKGEMRSNETVNSSGSAVENKTSFFGPTGQDTWTGSDERDEELQAISFEDDFPPLAMQQPRKGGQSGRNQQMLRRLLEEEFSQLQLDQSVEDEDDEGGAYGSCV